MEDVLAKIPFYRLTKSRSPETVLKRYERRICAIYSESESMFKMKDGWTNKPDEAELKNIREWYEELKHYPDQDIAPLTCYVLKF